MSKPILQHNCYFTIQYEVPNTPEKKAERGLGSVHYFYPGLVLKRNGLSKPFFCGIKGLVINFLNKGYG